MRATTVIGATVLCALGGDAARAAAFQTTITADNAYTILIGDASGATQVVGGGINFSSASQIFQTENWSFSATDVIYISAWNAGGAKGLLFDMENLDLGMDVSSGSGVWEAAVANETGRAGSLHTLAEFNALLADAATQPFEPAFVGQTNAQTGPLSVPVGSIDPDTNWIWDADTVGDGGTETVLFRYVIPAPSSAFGLIPLAVCALRRRR